MQQDLWEPLQLGWRGHGHRRRSMPDGGIKTSRADAPDVHYNLHTLYKLADRVYQDFCKRQSFIVETAGMMFQWGVPLTMLWIDAAHFGFMQPATIGAVINGDRVDIRGDDATIYRHHDETKAPLISIHEANTMRDDMRTTRAADDDAAVWPDLFADRLIQDYLQAVTSRDDVATDAVIPDYTDAATMGLDLTVNAMILDNSCCLNF